MHERCSDAMSLFAKFGAPDLFITFTANPNWAEIVDNLRPGETTSDRPDLVVRVFTIKLAALMDDLWKNNKLGRSKAYVYSIEFQKRGLPHAHILITLQAEDKFTTAERIDAFVSAEIPPTTQPSLREIVLRFMMHGPCGPSNPRAVCMENGTCKKEFPKPFTHTTTFDSHGYPSYRRRMMESVTVRGSQMHNCNVVPYNAFLTLRYNAHINVEVCTSLHAVKYIYKYIYKGFDCANVAITAVNQTEAQYNEITNFIDCRYVSAPEAMWRLLESKMHARSHTVTRLPVHLPNQQRLIFEEGHEAEALEEAQSNRTKLEAWFQLNSEDPTARQFLYTDIPQNYVYKEKKWVKRIRAGPMVVSSMYTVSARD